MLRAGAGGAGGLTLGRAGYIATVMRQALGGILLGFFAVLGCVPARAAFPHDRWLEIQSPHFTVYTDGSAGDGRDVAKHFELIREVFLKMSPSLHVDPAEPVVILAVRNGKDLEALLPAYWTKGHMHPAGFFVSALYRNFIALRMDVSSYDGYHVVYHEYVHLLERLNFSKLPVWLSEGLAEFYAAAVIQGSDVELGRPMAEHIELLRKNEWLPLEELLTATQSSPLYNENNLTSIFYAESWELTHYLMTAEKGTLQQGLVRYENLYGQGVPSLDAARQAFGDLNALTEQLHKYPYQLTFNYLKVKTTIPAGKAAYPVEAVAPAEAETVIGDFYIRTQRPVEARVALEQAIALDPKSPSPYGSMGVLAMSQRDMAAAGKWFDQAIALGSKDYLVYYDRATLSLVPIGGGDLSGPVGDLSRCLELNPKFANGDQLLAQLYAGRGAKLDVAEGLARRAIGLDPSSSLDHLTLALVLMRQRKYDEAKREANTALALAQNDVERERAERFLFTLEQARAAVASPPGEPVSTAGATSASTPRLMRRPETVAPAHSPESTPPGAGGQRTAPAKPGPGAAPRSGVYLVPEASVIRASCAGKALSLSVNVQGSKMNFFAPDTDAVGVEDLEASASARSGNREASGRREESATGSSLCSLPAKSHVAVWFRRAPGKAYSGTIVGIALKH